MEKSVFIVNGDHDYRSMFADRGWVETNVLQEADLVLFTGGEDVSPSLYGERTHPRTWANANRDKHETSIYKKALELGVPMVGICRGGQFLNVMNGGKMWQHVENHGISGTHPANVTGFIGNIGVTSTHHQMMIPNNDVEHIVLITAQLLGKKERMGDGGIGIITRYPGVGEEDVESVYYPETHSLCFQPHPEFKSGEGDCRDVFFFFINNYLLSNITMDKLSGVISDGILNKKTIKEILAA